ncbi:hypothetical protein COW36_01800 [bacterium (Candidatus Blackallbacteria) CG17_big_fil_post_rev_8_21_14_2_50_48_46]|uniref:Lipoprotein n=1 Tax=bacterium (Candidatus Blackallbacteria) CG17_big_fil_post_rev_8_21_14_2_50_48_46 TaxID=2014261 RepID=A0A2M7GAJ5_9BACT|nr:MAG: hypothetical protein COW64_26190 [bacterium (Candidatus Blackallbacteria) CG18_big_fil_WC_8_21_14_2_50_49_26]PIW19170.1 MAG: hypothetical protein COW36_01800 [bacterium (Candidatus Blackallbacteria) CG17_big_fil_post_rev_8_21_14_2_50_48_46]PIW45480.1 MAG: hypothetical protein COW20_20340 [bacterium (Candidatus Blackallbacteria) CG13_big_fil_rev_8_21_14_2_50_49_14]
MKQFWIWVLVLGGISACQVPQSPTSPAASASPDAGDPPCFVALQCIVDTTKDNALRKESQEVINQLIQTADPQFTKICLSRSQELLVKEPSCQKN